MPLVVAEEDSTFAMIAADSDMRMGEWRCRCARLDALPVENRNCQSAPRCEDISTTRVTSHGPVSRVPSHRRHTRSATTAKRRDQLDHQCIYPPGFRDYKRSTAGAGLRR